jgi:hypothetical protein
MQRIRVNAKPLLSRRDAGKFYLGKITMLPSKLRQFSMDAVGTAVI